MDSKTKDRMASSKNEHWCTPESVLECVREVNTIALDPCTNVFATVGPKKAVFPPQDGKALYWKDEVSKLGGGLVFVNPPYGDKVKGWVSKCWEEGTKGTEIILLTSARTETQWFQNYVLGKCDAMCFWRSRLTFIDGTVGFKKHPSFFPSVVSYWGPNVNKFIEVFNKKGFTITF